MWSAPYRDLTNRNLGLLNEDEQDKLRNACVAVCGLGGIGGPIAEMLCRAGVGNFKLLDHGRFEPSNLNRQVFCFTDTDGRLKTEVTEAFLHRINPDVITTCYENVDARNVDDLVAGTDAVALSIDSLRPILLVSRAARTKGIPLVEGWAMAFGNVRVYTRETPSVEEVYGFPTAERPVSAITDDEANQLAFDAVMKLRDIDGLADYYPDSAIQRFHNKGEGTTFAPMVWMTCAMMALEVVKAMLNWGTLALAPGMAVYDGLEHRVRTVRHHE